MVRSPTIGQEMPRRRESRGNGRPESSAARRGRGRVRFPSDAGVEGWSGAHPAPSRGPVSQAAKPAVALLFLALLSFVVPPATAGGASSPDDPLAQWTRRSPMPNGTEMLALTFGGGKFVAAGYGGVTMTSSNGADWTVQFQRARSH